MLRRPHSRTYLRGFTLIEMMAVVSIIAIMTALAAPSMIDILRDRRSQRDASDFMLVLQDARARAYGRGAATRATWNSAANAGRGLLSVNEALFDADGDNIGDLPSPSCGNTCEEGSTTATCSNFWTRTQSYWQLDTAEKRTIVEAHLNGSATILSTVSICFTPQGRSFEWDGTKWVPSVALYQFDFSTAASNGTPDAGRIPRTLYLTPTGLTRMKL
jgi:prepilin-type N-terminal cleavage/methylation domain-containing protein